MNGQWIGPYAGTNSGLLVVELDDVGDHYEGYAYAYDNNPSLPSVIGTVDFVPKTKTHFKRRVSLVPIDRQSGDIMNEEAVKKRYPGVTIPHYADTEWRIVEKGLSIKWVTDAATSGQGFVSRGNADKPSELAALTDVTTWNDFKQYASQLTPYAAMFRGQENNKWRLRTSFHRTGRAALPRFLTQDVKALQRHLSGLTTHRFNLADPLDNAAFYHLVQHHGYPTPLLDWTSSPFIAAYFAYRNLRSSNILVDQKVRILIFEGMQWNAAFQKASVLNPGFLHLTILEPLAINNPRAVPQQSLSLVTNIDDIGTYIRQRELDSSNTYLRAIDLPAIERKQVMRELSLMGVNGGTLFPGLDGACEQLRERFFDL
jgi:hypothetical protein